MVGHGWRWPEGPTLINVVMAGLYRWPASRRRRQGPTLHRPGPEADVTKG